MHVLLTGAFGTLGVATIDELLRQGHSVRCFDISSPANSKIAKKFGASIEVIWGDITDGEAVNQAVKGCEAVIHNAAVIPPGTEIHPERVQKINVEGTRNLIRALEKEPGDRPFVYPSSISVFGADVAKGSQVTAESPVCGSDRYTEQKLICEKMLQESDLAWVILRVGVVLSGNANNFDPLVFRLLFEISPDNPMETIHTTDAALAQVNAISKREAWRKTLLIGGGEGNQITQGCMLGALFEVLGVDIPAKALGKLPYYTCWMDTTESQALLQYQRHSFEEIHEELMARVRPFRWVLKALSPISRRMLLRLSGPWHGDPPRGTWIEFKEYFKR
jgi:nucleoside-diphosphate-sugar epimerase